MTSTRPRPDVAALVRTAQAALDTIFRAPSLDPALETLAGLVMEGTGIDACSISLADGTDMVVRGAGGWPVPVVGMRVRLGQGLAGRTAATRAMVEILDTHAAAAEGTFVPLGPIMDAYRSALGVPIIAFDDPSPLPLGVIIGVRHEPGVFEPLIRNRLELIAGILATAIRDYEERRQVQDHLEQARNHLAGLQEIALAAATQPGYQEITQAVVRVARQTLGISLATLWHRSRVDEDVIELVAWDGTTEEPPTGTRAQLQVGPVTESILEGRTTMCPDLRGPNRVQYERVARWAERTGVHAVASAPLRVGGRILGALAVFNEEPHEFSADERALLDLLAGQAAVALENARLLREAQEGIAHRDLLVAEMHHRVKNNLQTMAGLLNMQARAAGPPADTILQESANRVHSMAEVHDLLTSSESATVGLDDLVQRVSGKARVALGLDRLGITVTVDCPPVRVGSRQATALALVLNELITNAAIHGVIPRGPGAITIAAEPRNTHWLVTVTDEAPGTPRTFDPSREGHLGTRIVTSLVKDELQGTLRHIPQEHGYRVEVGFRVLAGASD